MYKLVKLMKTWRNWSMAKVAIVGLMIALLVVPPTANADVVIYKLPGTNLGMVLQGSTNVNAGGTITFSHPRFGNIYFKLADVDIHKVQTMQSRYTKEVGKAGKDPEKLMVAANWALQHGMINSVYDLTKKALEQNNQHPHANKIRELKRKMIIALPEPKAEEEELRRLVERPDMKIKTSAHFILLHDTPDKPAPNHRKSRAEERLDLLEQVYESFLLRFYARGVELEIPKQRLKVVLFADQANYLYFAKKLSPSLSSALGFYDPTTNTSVFFDNGTSPKFKALQRLSEKYQDLKADALRSRDSDAADIRRFADSLAFMIAIERENMDITVVSHEATHHMAAATGLFPRHVMMPSWVHEGLATYFETPDGAAWSGMGAVNGDRLDWYRMLETDREHSNIDFIVGDKIFDYAASNKATIHGYGQAWALTHFMMERHFDELMTFYRRLGELPPDLKVSSETLVKLFDESVKIDHSRLDSEWRAYMRSLKTDLEVILD